MAHVYYTTSCKRLSCFRFLNDNGEKQLMILGSNVSDWKICTEGFENQSFLYDVGEYDLVSDIYYNFQSRFNSTKPFINNQD